jgi:hypothetical protein
MSRNSNDDSPDYRDDKRLDNFETPESNYDQQTDSDSRLKRSMEKNFVAWGQVGVIHELGLFVWLVSRCSLSKSGEA